MNIFKSKQGNHIFVSKPLQTSLRAASVFNCRSKALFASCSAWEGQVQWNLRRLFQIWSGTYLLVWIKQLCQGPTANTWNSCLLITALWSSRNCNQAIQIHEILLCICQSSKDKILGPFLPLTIVGRDQNLHVGPRLQEQKRQYRYGVSACNMLNIGSRQRLNACVHPHLYQHVIHLYDCATLCRIFA